MTKASNASQVIHPSAVFVRCRKSAAEISCCSLGQLSWEIVKRFFRFSLLFILLFFALFERRFTNCLLLLLINSQPDYMSRVPSLDSREEEETNTTTLLYWRSMVFRILRPASSTLARELLTYTRPRMPWRDLSSELSGVRSSVLTVLTVLSVPSSPTT